MGEGIKTVRLTRGHPGDVRSGQIETDADVEVLDRDVHVATVSEGGKLQHRDAPEDRARIRERGQELRRGPGARLHPDRFGALARAQGELLGGSGAPRPDDRLRQADARSLDQRRGFAAGRHRLRREAAEGPHGHLHQLRGSARAGRGDFRARPRQDERGAEPLRGRTGAERSFVQLPEERQHPDHRRTGAEDRSRDAADEELRPQVAQRNQGNPGEHGACRSACASTRTGVWSRRRRSRPGRSRTWVPRKKASRTRSGNS